MSAPAPCNCGAGAHVDDCEGASLLPFIDIPRLRCLNELVVGSCARIFRSLAARREEGLELRSSADDAELLLHIPFTSPCRVKSLCVSGPSVGQPSVVRIFVDRDDLDFSNVSEATPAQELPLPLDETAALWHPLKAVRFGSASSLTLHFSGAEPHGGSPDSVVSFLGLKGVSSGLRRGLVTAVYELKPALSDHTVRADAGGGRVGL